MKDAFAELDRELTNSCDVSIANLKSFLIKIRIISLFPLKFICFNLNSITAICYFSLIFEAESKAVDTSFSTNTFIRYTYS